MRIEALHSTSTILALVAAIIVCGSPRDLTKAFAQEAVVVRGRVVAADRLTPLPRVQISIAGSGQPSTSVRSDEGGAFEIVAPAATGFSLRAARTGFLTASVPYTGRRAADPIEIRLVRVAVLSGRVNGPSGEPAAGMGVRIRRVGPSGAASAADVRVVSNDLGEFRVPSLAEGRYGLSAYRDFAELERGRRDDVDQERRVSQEPAIIGAPVSLSDEVVVDVVNGQDASVLLTCNEAPAVLPYARAGGAIAGVVLDEFGDPVEGVRVRLWHSRLVEGRTLARQFGASRTTDEQGRYRLFHIPPGTYLVEVVTDSIGRTPAPGPPRASLPLFYPGTRWVERALPVRVGLRQEQAGVDIVVSHLQPAMVRVFGSVVSAAGVPPGGSVNLVNVAPPGGVSLPPRRTGVDLSGAFQFEDVTPGEYILTATMSVPGGKPPFPLEFGLQYISVGETTAGPFRVQASPAATLSGRIVFEGIRPDGPPGQFLIAAHHVDPLTAPDLTFRMPTTGAHEDWSFEVPDVTGPTRLTLERAPAGWWLKSVNTPLAQRSHEPIAPETGDLTVVLSNASATLSGRVLNQDGQPNTGDVMVQAFPVDEDRWFDGSPDLRRTEIPGQDQRFSLTVPPGEYYVVALAPESVTTTADQEQLRALATVARRITVAAGQTVGNLRLEQVP